MPLISGMRLGRYEIRSKIGEGGMGEGFLATRGGMARCDALGCLKVDPANSYAAHSVRK